jgi:transposase
MPTELCDRYAALAPGSDPLEQVTVVFDADQNSRDNFTDLRARKIGYVTSLPPSDPPDLLALPTGDRTVVDPVRYPGMSPTLHAGQSRGLDQTLAKAQAKLSELANRLARGKTRRARPGVAAEITTIRKDAWVRRIWVWDLAGENPSELRLTWRLDDDARSGPGDDGLRVLVTNRETWPITDVVAANRSQSDAEFGSRQLKDPHVASFSPMNHWTDQAIRVHTYVCVLALQLAHLMRRQATQAGLPLSVRALPDTLAGIQETDLIHPSTGRRPEVAES